ncbi:MAG: YggT family protein [Clostridia bacterium]|nr:YggT family protein [Clostridia bacterium]MBR2908677.1 YggT family protein [Clostridia bacterium]
MDLMLYIIQITVIAILDVLELAFFARAILSWLPLDENAVTEVLFRITEPFIMPFRLLFRKLNLFQQLPIDMGFLFAVLAIGLLRFITVAL